MSWGRNLVRRIQRGHRMTAKPVHSFKQDLFTPVCPSLTGSHAPMCHTCLRDVDYEELVEAGHNYAKVLVRHHGAEELHTFEFGRRMNWNTDEAVDELSSRMRRRQWFSPEEHMGGPAPEKDKAGLDDHSVLS